MIMCICIYIYMHICIYTYICTHVCIYVCIYIYIYTQLHMYLCIYIYIYIQPITVIIQSNNHSHRKSLVPSRLAPAGCPGLGLDRPYGIMTSLSYS